MAKIPFSIKYRPQIESGEYKVETRDGRPVRIICWDANSYTPIVFLATEHDYLDDKDKEYQYSCNNFGRSFSVNSPSDLFIVTPEEELTEFEKALEVFLMNADSSEETFHEEVKEHAAKLLSLARDQFIKDGYVIEKKAFHDAVEKVDQEVMKEVSYKVDMEEALRLEYEKGRANVLKEIEQDPESSYDAFKRGLEYGKEEALKGLPMWKKRDDFDYPTQFCGVVISGGQTTTLPVVIADGYEISLPELLNKLPKEE